MPFGPELNPSDGISSSLYRKRNRSTKTTHRLTTSLNSEFLRSFQQIGPGSSVLNKKRVHFLMEKYRKYNKSTFLW